MEEATMYEVSVDCNCCDMGPHRVDVLVLATDKHTALDKATEHTNANRLWDEEIQRGLADGEDYNGRHNYDSYLREVEFVDAT